MNVRTPWTAILLLVLGGPRIAQGGPLPARSAPPKPAIPRIVRFTTPTTPEQTACAEAVRGFFKRKGIPRDSWIGDTTFTGERISLALDNADLVDTLKRFSELTGLSMNVPRRVKGSVTLKVVDRSWDEVLDRIVGEAGYGYRVQGEEFSLLSLEEIDLRVLCVRERSSGQK